MEDDPRVEAAAELSLELGTVEPELDTVQLELGTAPACYYYYLFPVSLVYKLIRKY